MDLHRQRIQERFYIHRRRKGDSERQQLRLQEKTCIGGASRQDHLIDEKGSRSESSSTEDPGELLHRQTEEGEVIHFVARIGRIRERSEIGRTERKVGNRTNSRTVGNRTNWKKGRKPDELENGRKPDELENGRKPDELEERSESGRT